MTLPFQVVERERIEQIPAGARVANPRPADFILTHGPSWTSKLIQFGQGLRIHGKDHIFTRWNHAAIFVDPDGSIIEALGGGVCRDRVSKYDGTDYHVVRISASDEDREEAASFAEYCVAETYGWPTIISIALSLLTGTKFSFGFDGQQICSGLVARALERTRAIFSREPSHIMPADLAKYYDVLAVEGPKAGDSQ